MTGTLLVYGAGGHGRKVYHCATSAGWIVSGFIDDSGGDAPVAGMRVYTRYGIPAHMKDHDVFVAIGNANSRRRLISELVSEGRRIPWLVHARAWVAPDATIGRGVIVAAGAVVESGCHVGEGAIVDVGAVVDHDCRIGPFMHVQPGAVLKSGCSLVAPLD
jgi:sugar O-acyltransferase (sialic acid O-acetyltransferase NeuD family)